MAAKTIHPCRSGSVSDGGRRFSQWVFAACVRGAIAMAVLLATGLAAAADRAATDRPATDAPPVGDGELDSAQLQDRPEPLVERTKRDEADQDRIDATVLFASARAHEQRQDYEQALRLYQRAVQAEPGSAAVLRRIIVLAFNLDRRAEAGRYAQLLVSDDADDAILLRRVGLELADQDDMQGALAICQRVEKMEAGGKVTPGSVLLWMELGRLYYMTQQYAQAAEEFAKVDAALNDPAQLGKNESLRKVILSKGEMTYQLFGECYLSADRLTAAQAAFEKANQSKADDALLAYNLARIDARRHEAAAALTLLEKSLDGKLEGQGIEPYQLLAKLLADTGHADQLQGRLEKLHAANPANASLTYYLAETYRKAGKTDLAEPLYRQLCTPSGERGPAIEALQGFIALLRTVGPKEELLGVLGTALEEADGWEGLGDAGKALLEDEKTVDGLLSAAAKEREAGTHRDHADRWVAAGMLALHREKYDDAAAYFELAIKAPGAPAGELLRMWGIELLTHDQFARAADVFRRGCDQKTFGAAGAGFYFYLSGALALDDKTDEALAAARQAAEMRPDMVRFDSRIGWILYRAKRYEEARAAYEQTLAKFDSDPASTDNREAIHDVRLALSNLEILTHHSDKAEEWLEQLWDEFPADAGVLNDLGYSWADQGKHLHRSLRMIEQAVAAEPKNMAFRDSLGWALYRLGRYPEAVVELRTAAAVEKPDATVLDHLGDALAAAGDRPAAIAAWQQAAAAFDADKEIEKGHAVRAKIDGPASGPSDAKPAAANTPPAEKPASPAAADDLPAKPAP